MKCQSYKNGDCVNNKDGICQTHKSEDGLSLHCCGSWSKDKIDHFEYYAEMFSTGMKNKWNGRLYYVDLFSGPGKCIARENLEEFDGTCMRAVNIKDKFNHYFLVDTNSLCIKDLKQRLKNEKNRSIFLQTTL